MAAVLLLAAGLRLASVGFGLPALNDPDEPLFVMTALEMLRDHTLNPGWFGHPGTTTLYGLALTSYLAAATGIVAGRFADAHAFVSAVYADPGIIFLPGRLLIVASGVVCVWLTYRIGTRIADRRIGLLAAFFLAINAVHIQYSQVIRTDVEASVFMLLATLRALAIARDGRCRDYVLAGLCVGLACATKWPAAVVVFSPACAGLSRIAFDRRALAHLALLGCVSTVTLFCVSPYLLIDYPTVLFDLGGEARSAHPGSTGAGFLSNLGWYAAHPLLRSFGSAGLILAAVGLVAMARDQAQVRAAALPGFLMFLVVICAQALVWERWVVPLLPFAALGIAYAIGAIADLGERRFGPDARHFAWIGAALVALPMLATTYANTDERLNDTRQIAAHWVRDHVPPGSSILVEHAAFDLFRGPWQLRFPVGAAGCIDARQALGGHIRYSRVERLRRGNPVVDIGYVDARKLTTCHADFAVFSHYTRYATDRRFAPQLARYRGLMRGGWIRAIIRPLPGYSGGPEIVIVETGPGVSRP